MLPPMLNNLSLSTEDEGALKSLLANFANIGSLVEFIFHHSPSILHIKFFFGSFCSVYHESYCTFFRIDLSLLVFELWVFDVFDLYRDFDLEKITHFDFYFFKTRPG